MKTIPLTRGQHAIVDDADHEFLSQWKWLAKPAHNRATYYAERGITINGRQTRTSIHRVLLAAPPGVQVDHKNGNGLDNRRSNLRLATNGQNQRNARRRSDNTSGYKGVTRERHYGWRAQILAHGHNKFLGTFKTKVAAAISYNIAAFHLHGEFAKLNNVFSGEVV